MSSLDVHMDGRLVGTIDGSDRRNLHFVYDSDYVVDPGSTPLSVSMPLRETGYGHSTVHAYLWGLLPDNDRVLDRWGREFGCSSSDVVGLLRNVGQDVAGAAQYVDSRDIPDESQSGDVEWIDDDRVAQLLREVNRDATAWRAQPEGRWSLSGAQPKIALLYDPDTRRWGVPSGATPTTHILKPASAAVADLDLNEHLCLATARNLGLRAARTSLRWFDDQRTLVVERYDRLRRPDGAILRVHQEDLCQALSVHPDRKYESDGGPTAVDLVELVRSVGSVTDVDRLHDALAYNWMLMATDGHAKNYSLLLSGRQVRLAPLYDVASGVPYLHPNEARMAQKIGGEYRPGFVQRRHWERLAKAFKLDPEVSRERIVGMINRVGDACDAAIDSSELNRGEHDEARRLADRLRTWTSRVRAAMQ